MNERTRACRVPADHPALAGHFPGAPVVPGVVLLDLVAEAIRKEQGATTLSSIAAVKFFRPLAPDRPFTIVYRQGTKGAWHFRLEDADGVLLTGESRWESPPT